MGILADVDVIAAAPPRLFAAGCGDLVAKLTAVRDWQLGHDATGEYYGEYAASLAMMSAQLVLDNSKRMGRADKSAVRDLVEALISTGVAAGIAGTQQALQRLGAPLQPRSGRHLPGKGPPRREVRDRHDTLGEDAGPGLEGGKEGSEATSAPRPQRQADRCHG